MRFALARTGVDRHHFLWTVHHVLVDGWSTVQLISEVLHHYRHQSLPALRGSYRDYIQWLQRQDAQASEQYWRGRLREFTEPTLLASAVPQAAGGEGYAEHIQTFDAAGTRALLEFARQERVTLNTLVQGALGADARSLFRTS